MPAVFNARTFERAINPEARYVGRPTKWGNPYYVGPFTRDEAVDKYREWLLAQPRLVEEARQELRGRDLICWCAPKRCHAEVLLEIANA